jgi:Polysaccharide deacetylase
MATSDFIRATDRVPFLLTMDLEIAPDHDLFEQAAILHTLSHDLAVRGLPLTIFATATAAEAFTCQLRALVSHGTEIACHGLAHGLDENFTSMPESRARAILTQATQRIVKAVDSVPFCFRGPSMMTSSTVHKVLIENGYLADFSVCPQRLDWLTCRGGTARWLRAPRTPYRPSSSSPFRKGALPLVVVPLSSAIVPFLSGVLYILGLRFMQLFFRTLLFEARRSQGVIVYQFHSYEFTHFVAEGADARPLRQRLYPSDPVRRYDLNLALLAYIAQQPVAPMAASAFALEWMKRRVR